jgi:hypothetical protein
VTVAKFNVSFNCSLRCIADEGCIAMIKKGSLVHVAPACAGSKEGSNHFGFYVCSVAAFPFEASALSVM